MYHLSCLPCLAGSLSPSLSPFKRVLGGVCKGWGGLGVFYYFFFF